jgi:hypothetical protein
MNRALPIPRSTRACIAVVAILVSLLSATRTPAAPPAPAEARDHWSFQPVRKPAPPAVRNSKWVKNPVDAFILARLEARKWQPAPPASREEWIRRVYFDLIGLPPSPDEIAAYLRDRSPDAEQRIVDHLLGTKQYGERWAQHWFDVIRYAETEGFEYDRHVPDAWRFRDYVIESLYADKPFDQFVREQIAGDELDPDNREFQTASSFHRLGAVRRNAGNPDIALSRNEVLTERTDIVGTAFLGLTVGCARCHDHKLEPILQKDYYRLQAYFAATEEHNIFLSTPDATEKWQVETDRIKAQMKAIQAKAKLAIGKEQEDLTAQVEALEDQLPTPPAIIPAIMNDAKTRTAIHVLKRGVWESKGEPVGPRPLSILVPETLPELAADTPNPRTRLAQWIADSQNPLTARVLVNRLWQSHFGSGLVKTANDFGLHGDRPTHPELLDWLAASLVENGWRLKPLHQIMVLSSTYRQSSRAPNAAAYERADAGNQLLWHFNRRRLGAEEIRDAMLAVSGRLNPKSGGPSIMLPVDAELVKSLYKPTQWQPPRDHAENDRRSVYLIAKRNLRLPFMEVFDAPALQTTCARRESSTHAPQALELLNGHLANDLAGAFAQRLDTECGADPERIVARAYALAAGRAPTAAERKLSLSFLREQSTREFALAMFNLNAFLHVP